MNILLRYILIAFFSYIAYLDPYEVINKYEQQKIFGPTHSLTITSPETAMFIVSGEVGLNDCKKIKSFINAQTQSKNFTVLLSSPGGVYIEGICLARYFKDANASTIVTNEKYKYKNRIIFDPKEYNGGKSVLCASACTYMFMAGKNRTLIGNVEFGIHNPGVPVDMIGYIPPTKFEYQTFRSAWMLEQTLDYIGMHNGDLKDLFFIIPNKKIFFVKPKYFKQTPDLKTLATEYVNFYGFTYKEGDD